MKTALSFGAGRQTVGIVVLMLTKQLPKVDLVCFADTGWEWPETYDYMARYIRPALAEAGIGDEEMMEMARKVLANEGTAAPAHKSEPLPFWKRINPRRRA